MVERRDIDFEVEGGDRLRGWLFRPEVDAAPHPAISMAHGYAGVEEHGLERFARAFAEAGFVVFLHDHRNFGSSDGAVRHDIDPLRQIADWRRAISFLEWAININLRKVRMSDTSQIALIRKLYAAMGDVNSFKSLLADDVEWDIEEGFPNGGVYRGIAGVFDFFTFSADFDLARAIRISGAGIAISG